MDFRNTGQQEKSLVSRSNHVPEVLAGVSLLLILFVTLSLSASLQKSPTADENFHLVAGYSYLKWGDYRINPEHPPFAKLLAALPLLALDIDDVPLVRERRDKVQANGKYGWLLANQWLFSSNDAETLFYYAKLPLLALGTILAILVFCWANELYGLSAAFAALAIYVVDPNILAHSPIIHTDVPFALTLFGSIYFFWRILREMTWFNWAGTVIFFSLSTVTKFSFLMIPLVWGLLGIIKALSSDPLPSKITSALLIEGFWTKLSCVAAIVVSAALLAYFTIWATYEFRYEAVTGQGGVLEVGASAEHSPCLISLIQFNNAYRLLPEAWFGGLIYALSSFNRPAYLLGEISQEGFWLYFPIAFAVKTPLPTLILLVLSFVTCLSRSRRHRLDVSVLVIPVLAFFFLAVHSRMNIGLRHILPIYPFLFTWIGVSVATLWDSQSTVKRCGVIVLGIWLLGTTLRCYPNYLAYFNETVDRSKAHEILVDSNLDWGQDLKALKQWMDHRGMRKIQLAYFGTADPAYYGINAIHKTGTWSTVLSNPRITNDTQVPPYIAISATHLVGVYLGSPNPYARFLLKKPVATIGHSILIYRMDN